MAPRLQGANRRVTSRVQSRGGTAAERGWCSRRGTSLWELAAWWPLGGCCMLALAAGCSATDNSVAAVSDRAPPGGSAEAAKQESSTAEGTEQTSTASPEPTEGHLAETPGSTAPSTHNPIANNPAGEEPTATNPPAVDSPPEAPAPNQPEPAEPTQPEPTPEPPDAPAAPEQAQPRTPQTWAARSPMQVPRSELSAAAMDGRVYLAGGYGNQSRFDAYDVATDTWIALADLPADRNHASIVAKDGYVYVFGGNRQTNSWRYDVAADTWQTREPLPLSRTSAVAVTLGDHIYLVGGAGASDRVLLRLNPQNDTWVQRAPLGETRDHPAAVAMNGKIYCIGGRAGGGTFRTSTEIYDPAQDAWSAGPMLGTPRSGAPAVVVDGQIAIFGGEISLAGRAVALDTTEALNVAQTQWQAWPQLPFGVHGVAAAVSDGRLFLFGGSTLPFGIVTVGDVNELTFE